MRFDDFDSPSEVEVKTGLGLKNEKLCFNLSGFKQEIINWKAVQFRLLEIIITFNLQISTTERSCCR